MKVICINPEEDLKVTVDKGYEIEGTCNINTHHQIRDDDGKLIWVFQKDFKVI